MTQAVIVTIPHRLGKEEAKRRMQNGFGDVRSHIGGNFVTLQDTWAGDHLDFRASLLGKSTTGSVDVSEDEVRLEVQLPWALALFAKKTKTLVKRQANLMLERPTSKR